MATTGVVSSLSTRLKRFRTRRRFISYGESGAVAGELDAWLDDLEAQLLPADPGAAWKLVERFIRSDEQIIGRADDSNGSIGDTFRRACGLWLRAAAVLPADPAWVERIHALHAGSDYGTRDALLDEAATRLSELELRRLARIYEQEARAAPMNDKEYRVLAAAAAMGQVARALGDAALYERSVRIRSPRLNDLQAADVAEVYLRFGPVERVVELLAEGDCEERFLDERLELLAEAYEKLGERASLFDVRRQLWERSLSAKRLRAYAALLPPAEADAARREALERAERSDSPVVAGAFLLDLGEDERAGALVLRLRGRLGAAHYEDLLALARRFEKSSQPVAAVACYRALADQILDAGRSIGGGKAMEVRAGMRVWVPCEVKPGVFPNERVVQVERSQGVWTGFVPESVLRERIEHGRTAVQALIYEVREGVVEAFLPFRSLRGPSSGRSSG